MGPLLHTLLASLITGATLGEPELAVLSTAGGIDALARDLEAAPGLLAAGIDARVAHLSGADGALSSAPALAEDSLTVLAPLADRAGLPIHRARLQDEAFRHQDPAAHASLVAQLGPVDGADAARLDHAVQSLTALVAELGIDAAVTGRVKSRYGLHRKAARKGVAPGALLDRVGVRLVVDDVEACYAILGEAHARWDEVPGATDDYIAAPKANGYRSLHTAVQMQGAPVELQVRTHEMHAAAETGPAAHWRYKIAQA